MNDNTQQTIQKNQQLPVAEDYFALRSEGLSFIEELGSAAWTDYNAHDPGITTLEALCYALSELGYRNGFNIEDLLTEENGLIGFRQAFYTARSILTNNPLTERDFRKILIDLPNIENGWLLCKACYCENQLYAECKESALFYAPLWRLDRRSVGKIRDEHPVFPKGLYDILLELEDDPELGDLNNRKILHTVNYKLQEAGQVVPLTIELRFPQDWEANNPELFQDFINENSYKVASIEVTRFSRDRILDELPSNESFVRGWRGVFYADFRITIEDITSTTTQILNLDQSAIRFFSTKEGVKREVEITTLLSDVLENAGPGGIVQKYRSKLARIEAAIREARIALHQYRNMGEDFCNIRSVGIEDIGVCMDVETTPDADIEVVWAHIYNAIELYFNPPVPFYTLQELVSEGIPTEDIFDGPALENGFIKTEELDASNLKAAVYVSDIINLIMDIEGVIAVKHVLLTRYNQEGHPILPAERWKAPITPGYIPRLYEQASRILFYKNGLPFLPRIDEGRAILTQLRGERSRPKIPIAENDFPVPSGQWRNLADFYPIQYTFPATYGIGAAGLPLDVSDQRRAKAAQFKGYLMVYEQAVGDMLVQLANARELFSMDEQVGQTYFQHFFDPLAAEPEIAGLPGLLRPSATADALHALTEPQEVFYDRRNRFLDHLLSRFGEQFRDYALMLYSNSDRIPQAPEKLIKDKIRFLKDYPRISAQRAKAFNYKDANKVCDLRNRAGLAERISRLLGMETLRAYFNIDIQANYEQYNTSFVLNDPISGNPLLVSAVPLVTNSVLEAELQMYELIGDVMAYSVDPSRYGTDGIGNGVLNDADSNAIAQLDSAATPEGIIDFAAGILYKERIYIVEHLLLRPKFPGDAVMPICLDKNCKELCGEEDPYSFRITYVMQGKLKPFSLDIDLRRFADETIRKETPSHLLPKICWVGNDVCLKWEDSAILCEIRDLLVGHLILPLEDEVEEERKRILKDICLCADAIFNAYNEAVGRWGAENDPANLTDVEVQQALEELFQDAVPEGELACHDRLEPAYYIALQNLVAPYFQNNLHCYQFNVFERAWCAWLEANTSFNWAAESDLLHRRVQRLLENHFEREDTPDYATFCRCVELLLGYFGNRFKDWINGLVDDGVNPDDGALPGQIETEVWAGFLEDLNTINENQRAFCSGLLHDTAPAFWEELRSLLIETYEDWILVSYRLNELIRIFTNLKSIYPSASLHDCDDGSDDNPVRLNNTILGSI